MGGREWGAGAGKWGGAVESTLTPEPVVSCACIHVPGGPSPNSSPPYPSPSIPCPSSATIQPAKRNDSQPRREPARVQLAIDVVALLLPLLLACLCPSARLRCCVIGESPVPACLGLARSNVQTARLAVRRIPAKVGVNWSRDTRHTPANPLSRTSVPPKTSRTTRALTQTYTRRVPADLPTTNHQPRNLSPAQHQHPHRHTNTTTTTTTTTKPTATTYHRHRQLHRHHHTLLTPTRPPCGIPHALNTTHTPQLAVPKPPPPAPPPPCLGKGARG